MAELEEVDLTKALAMLAHRVPWLARDIFVGADTRDQDTEIAAIFEHAARLLRDRARTRPPRIDAGRTSSPEG